MSKPKNIGARIREERQARGLSLEAVAARAGVSYHTLLRAELDHRKVRIEALGRILCALRLSRRDAADILCDAAGV